MEKIEVKNRFEQTMGKANLMETNTIIVDKETGIEYLYHGGASGGGLTVLLDRSGKPKISRDYQ